MFENMDDILQDISNVLMKYLNEEHTKLELFFKRTDGSSGFHGNIYNSNGKKSPLNIDDYDDDFLFDHFESLYQTMTKDSDKHKWNRAKVTLTSDGKLNIKFEWDQELEDELKRLEEEYDPRWDETLSVQERERKYKEMVEKGELPDLSKIDIIIEDKRGST